MGLDLNRLRYPIGPFTPPSGGDDVEPFIRGLEEAPARLRQAVDGLSEPQLDTQYREGGWTVRQVVHHLADASMNGFMRTKLALTEDTPVIKPFEEEGWALLPDAKEAEVGLSLAIHGALHDRWLVLLRSLRPEDFERSFRHPASGIWTLRKAIAFFDWHNRHHTAHITGLRERMNW